MSRSDALPTRRSVLMRATAATLGAVLLAGCSAVGGVGQGGTLVTGRDQLAPLSALPPAGKVTVQMLPFSGLPVTTGDAIFQRFRTLAKTSGIELVGRLEDPATYRVQAHFVALGAETSTTVVFTYEIFDASGARVHRIVGQEVAKLADGDPWSGVDTDAQMRLATRGVRAIKAWLTRAER